VAKKSGGFYQYKGAIHIHTTESDGTKTLEEVVAIGREVDLDFMMFSDHMTLIDRERGKEGFYGDTLVVVGYEHNDVEDIHHYLLFDSPRVYPSKMSAAEYVAAGAADNALGILAHPDEIRDALKEYPAYPWKDWSAKGYVGLELWNQMSEWTERLTRFNKLFMVFSPRKAIVSPTIRILKKWDELNTNHKVVGIAGADAHAFPVKAGPWTVEVFPYKVHFRTLRCYILLDEPMSKQVETARRQLYGAIRGCRLFFANVRWGDAEEFEFVASNGNETVSCGGTLDMGESVTLSVKLPSRADLRLIHNGKPVVRVETDNLDYHVVAPGIYRVEAWKKKRGWIFSNHIRVGV